jgi:hypothetical protein
MLRAALLGRQHRIPAVSSQRLARRTVGHEGDLGEERGNRWAVGHHGRTVVGRFSASGPRRKKNLDFLYSISSQHRSKKKIGKILRSFTKI